MLINSINELNHLDNQIFISINQLKKWNNRANINAIHNQVIKIPNFTNIKIEDLETRLKTLLGYDTIMKKRYNNIGL